MPQIKTTTKSSIDTEQTMDAILEEIKLLRNEISILLPQDNLDDYANPERIKASYEDALREHKSVLYGNNQD